MEEQQTIKSSSDVKNAVLYFLETQYRKINKINFSKVWYCEGVRRDVWEVEGRMELKTGLLSKQINSFRLQVDPITMKIIGFESHHLR